jgi:hypothetical protein
VKYLLDTNALLYIFSAPSELSARARRIVRSQSDLSVSIQYEPRGNGLCVRECARGSDPALTLLTPKGN